MSAVYPNKYVLRNSRLPHGWSLRMPFAVSSFLYYVDFTFVPDRACASTGTLCDEGCLVEYGVVFYRRGSLLAKCPRMTGLAACSRQRHRLVYMDWSIQNVSVSPLGGW